MFLCDCCEDTNELCLLEAGVDSNDLLFILEGTDDNDSTKLEFLPELRSDDLVASAIDNLLELFFLNNEDGGGTTPLLFIIT